MRLTPDDVEKTADLLELFAGIDEGENTDYDETMRLASVFRAATGQITPPLEQPSKPPASCDCGAEIVADGELGPICAEGHVGCVYEAMTVYVVFTPENGDLEILDEMPRWNFRELGQRVFVGNVNGGDSQEVVA